MITDKTLDETLVELLRCQRALEALRKARKQGDKRCPNDECVAAWKPMGFGMGDECVHCDTKMTLCMSPGPQHAAAKRSSMDLTRKLAALRAGR